LGLIIVLFKTIRIYTPFLIEANNTNKGRTHCRHRLGPHEVTTEAVRRASRWAVPARRQRMGKSAASPPCFCQEKRKEKIVCKNNFLSKREEKVILRWQAKRTNKKKRFIKMKKKFILWQYTMFLFFIY
jgi:hypothetical protein